MQNHPKTRIFFQGLVILLALWGGLFQSCRRAEPEQVTYAFTVIVTDESSHPFEGALVQVDREEKYTDKEGKCSFEGLKDTRLHVVVSAQYYHTIDQIYGLEGREDPTLRVTLPGQYRLENRVVLGGALVFHPGGPGQQNRVCRLVFPG